MQLTEHFHAKRQAAASAAEADMLIAQLVEALKHAQQNMPHPDQMIDDALARAEGKTNA